MTTEAGTTPQPTEAGMFGEDGNPYPAYERMRREAPVSLLSGMGLWAVSRYGDVVRVLRETETFSSIVSPKRLSGEETGPSMLFNDPPMHTRLRGLIAKAFTPKMVELQRPAIQAYCDQLIDKMLSDPDQADIVAGLAYPLPVMAIANMLGVAGGDLESFKRWSDVIIENLATVLFAGDDSGVRSVASEFDAYFTERLAELRQEPQQNLLSELVHVETEDGGLTQEELLMFCRLLLVAGNETTTGLIINAIRAFSEFPDALTRVREDMELLPSAMEEALRFYAPFQATFRRATRDVELSGQTIPANERIFVLLGSANRDETVFERPNEFDVARKPNRHVAFGSGIHTCVGAPLARLEADIAFGTLLPRVKGITVLDSQLGQMIRPGGPKSLRVRFELAG